jgi:hypothetical protein
MGVGVLVGVGEESVDCDEDDVLNRPGAFARRSTGNTGNRRGSRGSTRNDGKDSAQ